MAKQKNKWTNPVQSSEPLTGVPINQINPAKRYNPSAPAAVNINFKQPQVKTSGQEFRDALPGKVKAFGQQAISRSGDAIKNADPTRMASAALGIAGLAKTFNQEKPKISRPGELSLERQHSDIASMRNRASATNASAAAAAEMNIRHTAGSDLGSYLAGATTAQANRMQADNASHAQYDQLQSQQDIANTAIANQEREFNFNTKRSFDEGRYLEAMNAQQARRQEGQQMMQSALNYEVSRSADNRQYAEKVKEQEGKMRLAAMEQELRSAKDEVTRNAILKKYGLFDKPVE
jgi:hypothetical protein